MPIDKTGFIWMNGELVAWDEAKVHVLTHALHYGYGVFEGIRAYDTAEGPAVFRLADHIGRLFASAKMLMIDMPFTEEQIENATLELIKANGLSSCYIRPVAFTGYGEMGLNPLSSTIDVAIATWPWGAYLGEEGITKGIRAKVSSWRRHDPNAIPPAVKATGAYINSSLAKAEALKAGYDEAILLSPQGYVSECTGENIFVVKEGVIQYPPDSAGALAGITKRTVLELATDLGVEHREAFLLRSDLYMAEEVFITGTAAEIVPVAEVDDRTVGTGTPGPIAKELQNRYYAAVNGKDPKHRHWLSYVK
jgi:branched-chain amino acid aminotransferase